MDDELLELLEKAQLILEEEKNEGRTSRESSMVNTKIDEAILWRRKSL